MKNFLQKKLRGHLKRDLKLSFIKVTGLAIGFILQVIFTKVIGVAEYGIYVLFTTWTSLISTILMLGYDRLILKYLGYYYIQKKRERFRSILDKLIVYVCINSFIFLIIAFIVPHKFLIHSFFSNGLQRSTWLLIAIGAVIFTLFDLLGKVLSAMQRVELNYIRSEILYKFILLLSVLIFFFTFKNVIGINIIIVGVISAHLITLSAIILYIDRKRVIQYLRIKKEKVSISKENYIFFISSLNYYILTQIDKLVIGKFESLSILGVYGLVSTLISIISFSTIVYQRFYPKISNFVNTNDIYGLELEFKTVTRNSLLIALPLMMFVIVFTKDILHFFGEKFISGTPILRVLIWGQLVNFLTGPNGNVLNIGKHSRVDFINSIIIVCLTTILIFIGHKHFGVFGVAAATSFGLVLVNIIKVIEVKIFYKIFPYEIKNVVLTLIAFFSFLLIRMIDINIHNLIVRLFANFSLSLFTTILVIAVYYWILEKDYKQKVLFLYSLNSKKLK